jgi:hypothetical protein
MGIGPKRPARDVSSEVPRDAPERADRDSRLRSWTRQCPLRPRPFRHATRGTHDLLPEASISVFGARVYQRAPGALTGEVRSEVPEMLGFCHVA